ncbi:hypothetical protein BH708_07935 [Brachybacterium sp. P6-10-X1]|uniref:hypothetical protein n=1 Tax=Brachybacterium sp. P6-10-X1 TaxID=1903186 RepID=UPI000971821A|nr:hypothetical protein [Brachybacterium sp. P6-10-X1]APX32657.1 hypothetical protein BH708_07935 [Brachybacterium sp. P6-10-X1]
MLVGVPLLARGWYLIANDLPDVSIRRLQITVQWGGTFFGIALLAFGAYGLVTGTLGMMRKGVDAIDLGLGDAGITVRGGHVIPWASIAGATAVQYINESKIQLLWNGRNVNRALLLRLREPLDVPGAASKDGKHTVQIKLQRYPAAEYQKLFAEVVAALRSRRIQVVEAKKHKQT